MKRKLFVDLDGVCYDTIKRICELYNEDFRYYDGFEMARPSQIQSWDFEELQLVNKNYIDYYFTQPRFFDGLNQYAFSKIYIQKLLWDGYSITFVSKGSAPNLKLKQKWKDEHYPECDLVGVPLNHDKSQVNMAGGILIDDELRNLSTSNASVKICFGNVYPWNEEWNGLRCADWYQVYQKIKEVESEDKVSQN